jgi:ATP-dependent DNA helicase RecG
VTAPHEGERLLASLTGEQGEAEWLEFKQNLADPERIGEYVSALANGAAHSERAHGYLVWGVHDESHDVVGTTVVPPALKVGNEDLESWIVRLLTPHVPFRFIHAKSDDVDAWILEVGAATTRPVGFKGTEWIRVGSYKKKLKEHPEREHALWRLFDRVSFETGAARAQVAEDDVLDLIDYPTYFRLLDMPLPEGRRRILDYLEADHVIARGPAGWDVTNLGAALFAQDLGRFPGLARKSVRVIQYQGNSRIETIREREVRSGYAVGFERVIEHITGLLPSNEVIGRALRTEETMYPEIAVRELVANMLIHQDFTLRGTGPMVEIFDNRVEITNPGRPLIDARRFIDLPPRSRNEAIAAMMRRCHIAEERGSGWDKVAFQVELFQLPAPRVEVTESHTRTVLLGHQPLTKMDREDRVRAVYLHACLRQVMGEHTTNASVRERFGIPANSTAQASRLLRDATDSGLVALFDADVGYKSRRYLPFWALDESRPLA